MPSALKTWRQDRREAEYWQRAQVRAEHLPRGQVIEHIDTTIMTAGQAISRFRNSVDPETRNDQLLELRMNLEAALGMVDNVISRKFRS